MLEYSDVLSHGFSLKVWKENYRTSTKDKDIKSYTLAIANYKRFCNNIGGSYQNLVKPNQEHTDNVLYINQKKEQAKPDFNLEYLDNVDGLITDKKGIFLSTTSADCILLLFFDPIKKIIANVHSGWKGTLQKIGQKCVKQMIQEHGCRPENILCFICPSIRKCHFEVQQDVQKLYFDTFSYMKEIDDIITIGRVVEKVQKYNIDTVKINKILLEEIGVQKENIIDSKICSVCNSDIIHSYRVEKKGFGLNTAIIGLK